MLPLALDFENTVKKPRTRGTSIEWKDLNEVETFVRTVQDKEQKVIIHDLSVYS